MTNKELNEVANKVWNTFTDQMPEVFTGRDLLKIVISFVVNTAVWNKMACNQIYRFQTEKVDL